MATTAKKTTVTLSAQVNTKDCTYTDIGDAKTFVGAPDTARVSITNAAYVSVAEDGTEENYPYSITFSWSEDK